MVNNWNKILGEALSSLEPAERLPVVEWADKYIYLPDSGKWNSKDTPILVAILEALDDPTIHTIVCQKSAQVGYSVSIVCIYMLYRAFYCRDYRATIAALFPRTKSATDFESEKLWPIVEASPGLHSVFDMRPRSPDNKSTWKGLANGFIKLLASNSVSEVKSTTAGVAIAEEPDDCNVNTGGQGDSIGHLIARTKTISDPALRKILIGGTPTIDGLSQIQAWMLRSDQRRFMVPCHECGDSHELAIENLIWDEDAKVSHEVYGNVVLESALYVCPQCSVPWDDDELNENIRNYKVEASAPFHGVAGFYISELYSVFENSTLSSILKRKLDAEYRFNMGEKGPLIEFWNNVLGKCWAGGSESVNADQLEEKALDYKIGTVPAGGLIITTGVDFQHDRIAIIHRAFGRGEESWCVHWEEIQGNVLDPSDPVWGELWSILTRAWPHENGGALYSSSASLDSSDGTTSSNVYGFVRDHQGRALRLLAIKGSSHDYGKAPIFKIPKKEDVNSRHTKADKFGLQVYQVGTHQIKDIMTTRMLLVGVGAGRMHWPKDINPTYFDHMTAEVKEPQRNKRGQLIKEAWQKKSGRNNEGFDCEGYAYHSARGLNIHRYKDSDWDKLERQLNQNDMFGQASTPQDQSVKKKRKRKKVTGGI